MQSKQRNQTLLTSDEELNQKLQNDLKKEDPQGPYLNKDRLQKSIANELMKKDGQVHLVDLNLLVREEAKHFKHIKKFKEQRSHN
jgi:hypothetical protein